VQNKVLESMAMGCPTVVTQAALDGIDALPQRDLLIGNDEAAFSDAVLSILGSPELSFLLKRNGRAFIEERYTWGHSLEPLDELLIV
jgi:glycosyltransferase involved in cell wall biosynthesis